MYLYYYDYYCWWCVGRRESGGERYGGCRYVDWTNELLISLKHPRAREKKPNIRNYVSASSYAQTKKHLFEKLVFFFLFFAFLYMI